MSRYFDPNQPEMMDLPQPVSAELERDLDNLVSLNRWFGSRRLLAHYLRRWWSPEENYRVLDLCTGAGDLPRVMVDFARARNIEIQVVALDASPATIEIARRRSRGYEEINFVEGNALTYGKAAEFDLVHCSLALHHFSESDAVRLLTRCRLLSTRWVLASDLERSPLTTLGVWLLTGLVYREPMTRHDGRLSAKRAFSFREMRALAESAGWTSFGHERFAFCRQALWSDVSPVAEGVCMPAEACPG